MHGVTESQPLLKEEKKKELQHYTYSQFFFIGSPPINIYNLL